MNEQIHITAHFDIIEQHVDEVLTGFKKLAEASRKEPGCLSYILTRDIDSPLTYTVIECWASLKDFQDHLETPHFKEFKAFAQGKRENQKTYKLNQVL